MDSPQALFILRWLIRDTFCQALASRIVWIMLGVSAICVVFCLGVSVDGGDGLRVPDDDFLYHPGDLKPLTGPTRDLGTLHLLYGAMRISLPRDRACGVELIYVALGTWVAGSAGVLLTLVWAAGVVPDFLNPATAAVLLTKPTPRWLILTGKYVGVVLCVAVQSALFFLGTWTALGLRTGIWEVGYLAGAPLMTLHFAALYSFAIVLGVMTRSTVAGVLGSLLFWVVCVSVNFARHTALALPDLSGDVGSMTSIMGLFADVGYWLLPKPVDYLMTLELALGASAHMMTLSSAPDLGRAVASASFDAPAIVLTSLGFSTAMLVVAGSQLARTEY